MRRNERTNAVSARAPEHVPECPALALSAWRPALLLLFLAGSACSMTGAHLRQGPGTDYFRPDFGCGTDLIPAERDGRHLALRELLRQNFPGPEKPPFLVLAGESTVALFPVGFVQAEVGPLPMMNRAIGGETTMMMLSSMDSDIVSLAPSVVFLSIGGNDLLGGRCIGRIRDNVALILYKIHTRLPRTRVVLAGVPPVLSWKVNSVSPYLNGMLRELASENGSFVEYFDLWEPLADPDRPVLQQRFVRRVPVQLSPLARLAHSEPYQTDRIHFNEEGYRELARRLKPVLQRLQANR